MISYLIKQLSLNIIRLVFWTAIAAVGSLIILYSKSLDDDFFYIERSFTSASDLVNSTFVDLPEDVELEELVDAMMDGARDKAQRYLELASTVSFLVGSNGVVSLHGDRPADQCDSLLFSSLSVYSRMLLARTGYAHMYEKESQRRNAIQANSELITELKKVGKDGGIVRHKDCLSKSLSRDMITGLALVGAANDTEAVRRPFQDDMGKTNASTIRNLVKKSGAMGGLFLSPIGRSDPFASLASPTIISMMYPASFSLLVNDLDLLMPPPEGYVRHLSAMALMYELEAMTAGRNVASLVQNPLNGLWQDRFFMERQTLRRIHLLASRLSESDHSNLLFAILDAKIQLKMLDHLQYQHDINDSLSLEASRVDRRTVRMVLVASVLIRLKTLEAQGLFPDGLPSSNIGSRDEDYLWQRPSKLWHRADAVVAPAAPRVWSGVDYTLAVGLLSEMAEEQD